MLYVIILRDIMTKIETLNSITKFLELALSQDGLEFYLKIKKSFATDEEMFYDFLYDYLTIQKGGKTPDGSSIYADFTVYYDRFSNIQGERKILEQIAKYAKYYLMLRLEYIDNKEFARCISVINAYGAWDVYPFLLEVMDDWENNRIDSGALLEMLNVIEDLAYRRLQGEENIDLTSIGLDINRMLYNAAQRSVS